MPRGQTTTTITTTTTTAVTSAAATTTQKQQQQQLLLQQEGRQRLDAHIMFTAFGTISCSDSSAFSLIAFKLTTREMNILFLTSVVPNSGFME